jgi:tRNA pseudouridine38-40 synthase
MVRIALGIEYDGAPFHGWQSQPSGNTVQDTLERALAAMAAEPIRVLCAGRTDTGVHASAQVVHFDTVASRPGNAWVKGVNASLPASIAVLWAKPVAENFHARFCALSRRYVYVLSNRAVRPALGAGAIGWFPLPLDVERMREAAAALVGCHDFSAFRSVQCQAKSPVRDLRSLAIERSGDTIRFTLEANAFLHHMVRNIVGGLVYVGKGRHPPEWLAGVLASRDRSTAAPTFPPHGLYLTGVDYAPEWGLPIPPLSNPALNGG